MSDEMEKKETSHGWLKFALEFGPLILFFVLYSKWKEETFEILGTSYEGFIVVTAVFVPVILATTLIAWLVTGTLSKMQIFSAILVVVFGSMSVIFNDKSFIKMKPTLLYLFFGGSLAFGLMRGRSYMQDLMDSAFPLNDAGWMLLTKRVMWFFLGLAVLNEAVWRLTAHHPTDDVWVYFKTFGMPVLTFAFFVLQGDLFKKYPTTTSEAD